MMGSVLSVRREPGGPCQKRMEASGPGDDPLWVRPRSIFGLFILTTGLKSAQLCTIPSTLAPPRLMLAGTSFPHGFGAPPRGVATLSEGFQPRGTLLLYLVGSC